MGSKDNNRILHPCFCISEILFSVLNVLPKSSLPAVARTCQTLKELALDVLYYEMDTLIDVFLCLSDDLLLISPGGWVNSRRLTFRRGMLPSDWQTLRRYLNRVRLLRLTEQGRNDTLSLDVFKAVKPYCNGCLFPNLRSLTLDAVVLPSKFLGLLLGPRLTTVRLRRFDPITLSFVRDVIKSCPMVTNLGIQWTSFSDGYDNDVLNIMEDLTRLRQLKTLKFFTHLHSLSRLLLIPTRLPVLEWLHVTVHRNDLTFLKTLPSFTFSHLRKLRVTGAEPIQIAQVVRACNLRTVSTFTANVWTSSQNDDPEGLSALTRALGSSLDPTHLREINIGQSTVPRNMRDLSPPTFVLNAGVFEPLYVFRWLTTLSCTFPTQFALDDVTLALLSSSLPRLQKLCLCGEMGWQGAYGTTLTGLACVLQNCVDMCDLALIVNATAARNAAFASSQDVPSMGLNARITEVRLADSLIDNEVFAATQMQRMMPRLRTFMQLEGGFVVGRCVSDKWTAAQRLLRALSSSHTGQVSCSEEEKRI
ncbi:hypothetical protein CONPUDRAFT_137857 [Coniophora puteana RWD-64-598 SS2]|uniref:F-box domain-containing protein n=1 Tax=Coniophora puteana (strain RWD-64-598) TaxID=741705 RepID=A0A5M3MJW6_CONPW|nr:uncharacterized protein CONPUDRAFT_137857 [Coniophora puteana RWD-64-598 SS2]EIW79518.1 hypothetical protein CONPUDRAFT_137857 [Coniophora puteana RWD-64-598 SS2]